MSGLKVRSNAVESVYRRVNPDDWDGDGLANELDANPTAYDGDFFGPSNVLPEGANTNAYCTVSVVANGPDALIRFEGDGQSDYPDPVFVARRGETTRLICCCVVFRKVVRRRSRDWSSIYSGVCR